MASTSACYKLFREKQKEGHGEAIMFKGECSRGPGSEPGPQGGLWEDGAGERFDPTPSSTSGRQPAPRPWGHPGGRRPWPLRCGQPHLKLPTAPYDHRQWPEVLRDPVWDASNGTSPRGELNGSQLKCDLHSGTLCLEGS